MYKLIAPWNGVKLKQIPLIYHTTTAVTRLPTRSRHYVVVMMIISLGDFHRGTGALEGFE